MNSRNQSETECYNISVALQIEGICDIFKSCSEVRLLSQLMKSNENDSVSINEDTTEVIPNQCKCSTNETSSSPASVNDAVIAASVLSVVVAIAIVAVIIAIIFHRRKARKIVIQE